MVNKDSDDRVASKELDALARKFVDAMSSDKDKGAVKRGFRMGKLGLGLAGSYLSYQIQNLFLGEGRRAEKRKLFNALAALQVREELQSLKGPIMKLGQTLSMQSQLLPEEVMRELVELQMHAPAMHPTLSRAQFKGSFGKFPEEVYREFAPEPFAAASLGQVHKAVTRTGEEVAVKIQYPAIRSAIENDFKLLRSISLPAQLSSLAPKGLIGELEQGILEETDYINEGKNIDFFREKLKQLLYVEVPKVFWELTTDRVLTMSYVPGRPLSDFLLTQKPSQPMRDEIGARLLALFIYQLRRIHAIHADPHPGNYLIDPSGRIGLVDFGCVKRFSRDFIQLINGFEQQDWFASKEKSHRIAQIAWGPKVSERPRVMRKLLTGTKELHDRVFPVSGCVDFGDAEVLRTMFQLWNDSIRSKGVNPQFAFFGRAEMGLYNVLHQLRAKIATGYISEHLESPYPFQL